MDAFPAPTMAFYRDASLKQSIKVGTAVVVVIDNDDDGDDDDDDDDDDGGGCHLEPPDKG